MSPSSNRTRTKRVTIHDVAAAAGVSTATASRALNGARNVAPELSARVARASEALNYRPDGIARSLRQARSFSVGLLVPDITNPFCAEVARGAEHALAAAGYVTILGDGERDVNRERDYLRVLSEAGVAGFLVNSSAHDPGYFETFAARYGLPVVLVDTLRSSRLDCVRTDNFAGTLHAMAHLTSRGYRRIAIVAGNQAVLSGSERLEAYRRAVEMYGLESHEGYVQTGTFSEESGYRLALELLDCSPRPQVIFAANNSIGFGVFRALKARGIRIPAEMGLLMFDDFALADLCDPPVTVIAQPIVEIGRTAAQLLLRRLGGETADAQEVVLPPRLILRASV